MVQQSNYTANYQSAIKVPQKTNLKYTKTENAIPGVDHKNNNADPKGTNTFFGINAKTKIQIRRVVEVPSI